MELDTKIYLVDENGEKFMGIGVLWLLEAIGDGYSLRSAAAKMNLSYSKAYSMLNRLEKTVGINFVEHKRGGAQRQGVVLTDFARSYIELYKDFQRKAKSASYAVFKEYKKKVDELIEENAKDD